MSEVTRACIHCGALVPTTSQYCPSCGAPASGPSAEEPRQTSPGSTKPLHLLAEKADLAAQAEETETPFVADPQPEPEPLRPSGLTLDWDQTLLEALEEAAKLEGTSVDRFLRQLVVPAVQRVLRTKKGLLTLNQAADVLGVTRKEVLQMINSGRLLARKVEDEWKVEQSSVDQDAEAKANREDQIELDLRQLVDTSGLMGLNVDGDASDSVAATLCFVNQEGVLVAPRTAWRKLGRTKLLAEAKDAVRRYLRRRDRELGRL